MAEAALTPEILVIGAGPGGSAAAWGLAQGGRDVLLVDRAHFPRDKTCGDGLTPAAVRSLAEMGALAAVEAAGAFRVEWVRLTSPFGVVTTLPLSELQPDHPYALVLPRIQLDNTLRRHAVAAGADFRGGVKVERVVWDGHRVAEIIATTAEGPLVIRAKYVVFATGAHMGLLRKAGLLPRRLRFIRAARGYYAPFHTEPAYYDFYFDEALLPGYGWIFPAGDGRANVGVGVLPVFWSPEEPVHRLFERFVRQRVAQATQQEVDRIGPVKRFPLRIDFPSARVAGENWLLVGEAAGLVNPVSGEGIDLALESGLLAADVIQTASRDGRSSGGMYRRALWGRFAPMFFGLRALRDVILLPIIADYAFWVMSQHRYLARITMKVAQGLQPPWRVLDPLFIFQFLLPISPRWVADELGRYLLRGER